MSLSTNLNTFWSIIWDVFFPWPPGFVPLGNYAVSTMHWLYIFIDLFDLLSQTYTNADNPFGDHHLLQKFVWEEVRHTALSSYAL